MQPINAVEPKTDNSFKVEQFKACFIKVKVAGKQTPLFFHVVVEAASRSVLGLNLEVVWSTKNSNPNLDPESHEGYASIE